MSTNAHIDIATPCGPVRFDHRKAMWVHDHKTLVLGDIHFEKGSYLRTAGQHPIPLYDTQDNLARLQAIVEAYQPDICIALGDSFHDKDAEDRFSTDFITRINSVVAQIDKFVWITGNHDPDIPTVLNGERMASLFVGNFFFTHEPDDTHPYAINVCGHLHPKIKLNLRSGRVSGPCFVSSAKRIILPSFGAFTGGLWVTDPAIQDIVHAPRYYLCKGGGVYAVPHSDKLNTKKRRG